MGVACIFMRREYTNIPLDNFRVNFSLLYQNLYLIISGVRLNFCLMVNEYADLPIQKH